MYTTITESSDPTNPVLYTGIVLASNTTDLQSWSVLKTKKDVMLFIDGQHQLSNSDEHIYHEQFVHSLLCGIQSPRNVLILGGGDGCTAREVLRWSNVQSVTQIDWDESLVNYFKEQGSFWNSNAYKDPRLTVISTDALTWIQQTTDQFDAIFIDLLDPTDSTIEFLTLILQHCKPRISPRGGLSINAGLIQEAFTPACTLAKTMKLLFSDPTYIRSIQHVTVPSFLGTWGFLQIIPSSWSRMVYDTILPKGLQFCTLSKIIEGTLCPSTYPVELQHFWNTPQDSCKKLTSDTVLREITEYYGC
jgi:spermidine synthase